MKNKAHAFASIPINIGTKAAQANATTKALPKSLQSQRRKTEIVKQIDREIIEDNKHLGGNFSYPSSAAAVVFGVYL